MEKLSSLLILMFLSVPSFCQNITLKKAWENTDMKTPESVFYHQPTGNLYVSNINGTPNGKDGQGFLSIISINGEVKNLKWVDGLNAPKGISVFGETLYVTDIDELIEVNLNSGKIIRRHSVPGATFLNDCTADTNGDIYFSDSDQSKIHLLSNGKITDWLYDAEIKRPNGVYITSEHVFVLSSEDGLLHKVDKKTKERKVVAEGFGHGDGLVPDGDTGMFASSWFGKLFYIDKNLKVTVLLDTEKEEINTADIEYIVDKKLLVVPTFYKNSIVAFEVQESK